MPPKCLRGQGDGRKGTGECGSDVRLHSAINKVQASQLTPACQDCTWIKKAIGDEVQVPIRPAFTTVSGIGALLTMPNEILGREHERVRWEGNVSELLQFATYPRNHPMQDT